MGRGIVGDKKQIWNVPQIFKDITISSKLTANSGTTIDLSLATVTLPETAGLPDTIVVRGVKAETASGITLSNMAGTAVMTVTDDEKVGIGVTVPSSNLDLRRTTGECTLNVQSDDDNASLILDSGGTGTNGDSRIYFRYDNANKWSVFNDYSDGDDFVIYNESQGESAVIIDEATSDVKIQNGNLGIGISTPLSPLHAEIPAGNSPGSYAAQVLNKSDENGSQHGLRVSTMAGGGDPFVVSIDDLVSHHVVVKNSGNVGIGTASPGQMLHVEGDGAAAYGDFYSYRDNVFGGGVRFAHARGTVATPLVLNNDDIIGAIDFRGYDGFAFQSAVAIRGYVDGTPGAGDMPSRLEFYTTPDGSSTLNRRMTIDSSGNVGIGTSSPAELLSLEGSGATVIVKDSDAHSSGNNGGLINFQGKDSGENNKAFATIQGLSSGSNDGQLAFSSRVAGTLTEGMRLDEQGNVGIGTASPELRTHIEFTQVGEGEGLLINNLNNVDGDYSSIYLGHHTGGHKAGIGFVKSGDYGRGDLVFAIDSTQDTGNVSFASNEAMRLDNDGNLGLGTSNPTSKAHIKGADDLQLKVESNSGVKTVVRASETVGTIGTETAHDLYIRTGNTARIAVRDSTGAVGIGILAPVTTLDVAGPIRPQSYAVGSVPDATLMEGAMIYVSNEAGGKVPAFSDGANWLRVTDRAEITV